MGSTLRSQTFATRSILRWGSVCGLLLLVAGTGAALLDARSAAGRVQRNVVVAGEQVGRLSSSEVDAFIDRLEGRYRTMSIGIVPAQGAFSASGADLGVSVKRERLRSQLLSLGHQGGAGARISAYFGSFFGTTTVAVPISIDASTVAATIRENDKVEGQQPIDPKLAVEGDKFVIKPGKPGKGISASVVTATLEQRLGDGPAELQIPVERVTLPSRYTDAELRNLLDRAVLLTSKPLPVRVDGKEITLQPKQLRRLVTPTIDQGQVTLELDGEQTLAAVLKGVGKVGRPAKNARLQVNGDGTVTAVPAEKGRKCCAENAADQLNAALSAGDGQLVTLEMIEIEPKVSTERVQALGVKELIGTFTTKHAPGEVRVKNIHHISDLLRGIVIQPGDTFSVNDTIGPRTAANGFFKAKVIEDGVYAENFGGGISQFATTMFNAAFFAGLDLVEYQSHSLYIKRYPYGREATLSFPNPDLKIRNNTPYGILIWPTYTDRSITVGFYSTKFVKGEVIDQVVENKDQCKVVFTYRLRTFEDGTTKKDRTRALYRPAEGKDCKGRPTAGATTTLPKVRTTKPPSSANDSGNDSDNDNDSGNDSDATETTKKKPREDAPETRATPIPVQGDDSPPPTKKPKTTKPKAKTEPEPRPEPKPEPRPDPTSPPDDGGDVGVGGPPVTGLG
jgi:vancomycin resistance protein YoaR